MKRIFVLVICILLCASMILGFSGCKKNNLTKEQSKNVDVAAGNSGIRDINPENLNAIAAINGDENSGSVITDSGNNVTYFIAPNGLGAAHEITAKTCAYYDFDKDGVTEVIAVGPSTRYKEYNMAVIFDCDTTPLVDINEEGMNFLARCFFDGKVELSLTEESDGIHIWGSGKDYGAAGFNGPHLQLPNYNDFSKKTDKPDMNVFDPPYVEHTASTGNYVRVYNVNGKSVKVPDDFLYRWDNPLEINTAAVLAYSFEATYLEKITGVKMTSLGKENDAKAITVIYGKKYIPWSNIQDYFKGVTFEYERDAFNFTVAAAQTKTSEKTTKSTPA